MAEPEEITEELQVLLKKVCDHFDQEDRSVRERQIRVWRKQKLLWEGFSRIYYSDVAHDWRIWDDSQQSGDESYQDYYDKSINVYRAYLESIIAALSVIVPPVRCYPDDADNNLDIQTAKAGDKIAELIFRHNDAPLLWIHALFILATEGMVASYCYPKSDKSYGTYEKEEYGEVTEEQQFYVCPICQFEMESEEPAEKQTRQIIDEYAPDDSDVVLQDLVSDGLELCPNCATTIKPELQTKPIIATRLVGVTQEPKTRICMEVYGGLYVKVPVYAMEQKDIPYLEFLYETNIVNVFERFPELHRKFSGDANKFQSSAGAYDSYEQWARLSPQYRNEIPRDTITVRNFWLRPAAFNYLSEEESNKLKKRFPNGARVVYANEEFAEAENESLDDCWTLTKNPVSDYIHFDPLGVALNSVQEITADIISLTLQTIEQGVGQTFADQTVVNFDQYGQREVLPGSLNPVKVPSGRNLGEFFHEIKTANLSGEILPFTERIQQLGQLASGALPSLFGGQMTESRTASEYSMSRNQASQRLQNHWKMMTYWWKNIFGKVIPMYIKEVQTDEVDVRKTEDGNFINVIIRKAELEGKIGRVELEANENLPLTWNQKKDIIMQLFTLGNPDILAQLGHPDNLPIIREAIGLSDFKIMGEDERDDEYEEIKLLVQSEPIIVPPTMDPMMLQQVAMQGGMVTPEMMQATQPQEVPSIEINKEFQNHQLRLEVDKRWINSEAGKLAKIEKPDGYKNVLLHAMQHLMQVQMMQMPMGPLPEQGGGGGQENQTGQSNQTRPKESTSAPIKEESDVRTN